MKTWVAVLGILGLNALMAKAEPPHPNVLFIAVDDLNDWIGCLGGNPDAKTPNLDRLASRGVLFTNAMCPAPSCLPSRGALMTGKAPANTGLYRNLSGHFRMYDDLKDTQIIPAYFQEYGYKTFGVGKLLHHFRAEDYEEALDNVYWKNPQPKGVDIDKIPSTVEQSLPWWAPVNVENSEMKDWQAAHWIAERLGKKHDKPFFMACGIFKPHEPWNVPQKYYDKFPLEALTLPKIKMDDLNDVGIPVRDPNPLASAIVSDEKVWRTAVQSYLANINFADDCLGVILDALDQSAYKDNTIIVLWSDHGWHLGEKQRWTKFTLWEEAARCVLMVAGPGISGNKRCDHPVNLLDIFPTLNELCGLPAKKDIDGASFLPSLKNPEAKDLRDPTVTANEVGFTVRDTRWRYIVYRDGSEELYDHQTDPMEWTNLAGNSELSATKARLQSFVPENPRAERDMVLKQRAQEHLD
jgi:arylsulfatase A-like enzyme